ncbi:MAG TPA: regulatory signaling modulator protein AmpE [Pseudomonas sp.]|uniref:regulatory signaling modulator protein AmpE n=1 Tax=Pseudomonas sp. TaxID=306 RepID=UPI002C92EAB2|nr:regulatory signaling modulator protein AmpE [Pseudomonas sp.]HRL93659.1 regulatory signaling modulator protein AmpE [Pseudomonas sp.]
MSFLVLLLAVWVEKFSAGRQRIQQDGGWLRQLARVEAAPSMQASPWLSLALLVLVPVLLLGVLLLLLKSVAYGWLALPVHLLVLIYGLGRGDVLAALGPFRDAWRRDDTEAAYLVAARDLGVQADEPGELLTRVQGYLLWQAYQSFFAVIFWYALLGPVAVLAYRLLALTTEQAQQVALRERAQQLRHAFDWLPARVLASSFALVGDFVSVSRALLHELLNWQISAAQLVDHAGRAAANTPASAPGDIGLHSLDSLWEMLVRSALLWYAGFAVWTLLL